MGVQFNADEIFEIAEMIERNGAAFYRRAAENVADASARKRLLEFAEWEDKHLHIFAEMRKELAGKACEPDTDDPEGLTGAYLKALADRRVFDYQEEPAKKFADRTNLADILYDSRLKFPDRGHYISAYKTGKFNRDWYNYRHRPGEGLDRLLSGHEGNGAREPGQREDRLDS